MTDRTVQRLSTLLDTEHKALLAGDLEKVGALAVEKDALAAEIGAVNTRELAAVANLLTRNSVLLAAARDGVTAVLTTLGKQRAARNTLSSYDCKGKATTIAQPDRGTERRF